MTSIRAAGLALALLAVSSFGFAQDQTELQALYRVSVERAQAVFAKNDYPGAVEAYEAARVIAGRMADNRQMAVCDRAIGLAHYRQGHVTQALEAYQRGLAPAEAAGDKNVLAELWRGAGLAQRASGNREAATAAAERSLALSRELGDLRAVAGMLNNLATLSGDAGDRRREGELLTESLRIAEANHSDDMVRAAYDNLATMYMSQGDTLVGIDYLEKGIRLGETAHVDSRVLAGNLNNLAIAHESLGRYDEAEADFARGLALARAAGDERRVATLLLNRGSLHRMLGSYPAALDDLRESGALFDKNRIVAGSIDVLANLAQVHLAMGDSARAFDEGQQAAVRSRAISEPRLLLRSLEMIGDASLRLGQREAARTAFREEVAVVEEMRRRLSGGGQEGTFFLADKMNPYRGLIALEADDGHAAEAFRIAEQAKARQLLDVLRSGRVPVTKSMTVAEKDQERRLVSAVAAAEVQLSRAGATDSASGARTTLGRATGELDAFLATLYAAHPELRLQRAEFQPLSIQDAAALLPDAKTALIEYVVGNDRVFLFLLVRGANGEPQLSVHALAVRQAALERDVEHFREKLATRDLSYRPLAASLYRQLLGPVAASLRGKTLVGIVPDGPLWSVPFQALTTASGRAFVEDHAVFYAPSLTTLRESVRLRRPASPDRSLTLLAMGGPTLGADLNFLPLPESAREVRRLEALYGAQSSAAFVGDQARKDRWTREAPRYRVLHLATHGVLDSVNPLYSYLVLGRGEGAEDNGFLEAREILGLDLHADLTVLSACETARGRFSDGEGVVGMSWAFLLAGSPTTVVSQWKVVESSTSQFMEAFHRSLLATSSVTLTAKARALQRASIALLRAPATRHPFYWAAFTMIGDGY